MNFNFWNRIKTACMAAALASATLAAHAQPTPHLSVRNEVKHAIDRGLAWLEKNQHPDGHWSTPEHPAVTALVLTAFNGDPAERYRGSNKENLNKAYSFILQHIQPDGGIYKKDLPNYNTALSMMALLTSRRPHTDTVVRKARQFLVGLQSDFDEKYVLDNPKDGGIGYGSKYPHSDMSNTLLALEALYHSRHLAADTSIAGAKDLNWQGVIHFIQNCQNLPSHNKQPWASDDPANKGGFVYYPGYSMAGETNLPNGRIALRSYGSISYAGLLSYIYADLKKDDPRVRAVFDWLQQNYTLEENPGMGAQGLFYYYHTMSKALDTYGMDKLKLPDGTLVDWRRNLAVRLINLQKPDGSWINDTARWWENDPVLVTAYAVIALERIYRDL